MGVGARDHAPVTGTLVLEEVRTERLIGREPRRGDAGALEAIYGEPGVARWLFPGGRPTHLDQAASMVDRDMAHWRAHGFGRWYWVAVDSSQLVARCGPSLAVVDGEPEVELHWAVRPDVQGRGFGTEATEAAVEVCLRVLAIRSVVAYAHADNTPSRRLMRRTGFAPERTFEHAGAPHVLGRRAAG